MTSQTTFYVYVHSRLHAGTPFYVGKGRRDRSHSSRYRNQHWKNIVAKDGGFHVSFIAKDLDEDFAFLLECELIDRYKRMGVKLVNQTNGGEGASGFKHKPLSPEARMKISNRMMGNTNTLGLKLSEATRFKMSASQTGRKHSDQTKEKMRIIGLKRGISDELKEKMLANRKNGPLSQETKNKMSATRKGRPAINKGKSHSEETKNKMSIAHFERWKKIKGLANV